jgi:hydroxyacylglutathione hydrolase
MLEISQISVLTDNYIYLIHDSESVTTAVIDPAVAEPVYKALDARGWTLDYILNTHHHSDHVGANLELKQSTHCRIVGSAVDQQRIPGIDICLEQGDQFSIGQHRATVLEMDGHTIGHIAYWFADEALLFSGDTLFSLGCGRLFEGSAQQMWQSLLTIKALPDATRIYCSHEYTLDNGRFALHIEPDNEDLQQRISEVQDLRSKQQPTVPASLHQEKLTNPFLRADSPQLQQSIGMENTDPLNVFTYLREQKDHFRG